MLAPTGNRETISDRQDSRRVLARTAFLEFGRTPKARAVANQAWGLLVARAEIDYFDKHHLPGIIARYKAVPERTPLEFQVVPETDHRVWKPEQVDDLVADSLRAFVDSYNPELARLEGREQARRVRHITGAGSNGRLVIAAWSEIADAYAPLPPQSA